MYRLVLSSKEVYDEKSLVVALSLFCSESWGLSGDETAAPAGAYMDGRERKD